MKVGGLGVREGKEEQQQKNRVHTRPWIGPILYCKFVSNVVAFHWPTYRSLTGCYHTPTTLHCVYFLLTWPIIWCNLYRLGSHPPLVGSALGLAIFAYHKYVITKPLSSFLFAAPALFFQLPSSKSLGT